MLDGMLLSTVEQMYADTWTVRCSDVSAVIVLLWDYFLTLDDEVDFSALFLFWTLVLTAVNQVTYVWSSRRSTVKFLILFNRYGNILAQSLFLAQSIGLLDIQFSSCLIFACVKASSHFLSFSSVHILVLMRAWVLCGRGRKMNMVLITAFLFYFFFNVALLSYSLGIHQRIDPTWSPAGICIRRIAPYTWLLWVVSFLLDTSLFLITVVALRQQARETCHSQIAYLVRSLYIDSIIFLSANTLSDVLNALAWILFAQRQLNSMANSLCLALVSITGQRLAINLRRTYVVKKQQSATELSRVVNQQLAALHISTIPPTLEPIGSDHCL
ncbi:hypothetical protein BJ138DRAFT_888679 [Hygrophoropsis aurantiaca]|uniref:Uncharacterized protein n=1 Tax=Hygrophoropsis aurantiaca TaxID=72124 RepID=A0ACB8AG08_9AGAM|nr:hypothetical protein BJ138DRAFT_888679 [Hygrophoropsis aurantiaca]